MSTHSCLRIFLLQIASICLSKGRSPPYISPRRGLEGRLIGGIEARPHEFPYQLLLRVGPGKRFCGASLVVLHGIQFALTAAHCVKDKTVNYLTNVSPDSVHIIAGAHFREGSGQQKETRRAVRVVMHPMYKKPDGNDIALVFYEPPFRKSNAIRPIDLPERGWRPPPYVTLSGWGIYDESRNASKILRKSTMWTISNDECQSYSHRAITDFLFCVLANEDTPEGTCSGDSGGPVVGRNPYNYRLYLYGVVNFHQGNCGDHISAFALVPAYMQWIGNTVAEYKRRRFEWDYR